MPSPLPVLALRVTVAVLDRLERAAAGEADAAADLGALAELLGAGKE